MSVFGDEGVAGTVALADLGGVDCTAAVLAAYDRAFAHCGEASIVRLDHPLARIRFAGFVQTATALGLHLAALDPATLSPDLLKLLNYGARRSDADRHEDQAVLAATASAVRAAVADGAVLLMPTTPQAAFTDTTPAPANQADFTALANIAGLPAVSIPNGVDADGMPVAVQLVTRAGSEAGLFAAARALDTALAACRRPPHFCEGDRA